MPSNEFRKLVKDALDHLYDTAYLEVHPLLAQVRGVAIANRSTRAQELRSMLKNAVEELRPPQGLPSGSPEWRSYLVLRCRYVQGMNIGQVESELGLSRRQLQRETLKGLDALASILWANHTVNADVMPVEESEKGLPFDDLEDEADPLEVELDQWKLVLQNCDVHDLVNDSLWLIQTALENEHPQIQVDFPTKLPLVVVDSTLTRQALFKILRLVMRNSMEETSITAISGDQFVTIRLLNAGCSFDQAESDWQAAQRIFSDQGGSLNLESASRQIIIRLPLAGQIRILVIDDNPGILNLFERYLAPHHYEVKKAQAGGEALALASENPPDLVILDVMMPTLDGWQVLRSLKQNPATQKIPIIICSVLKEPELAISLGASAYLKKPVDRLELLTAVEQILHP